MNLKWKQAPKPATPFIQKWLLRDIDNPDELWHYAVVYKKENGNFWSAALFPGPRHTENKSDECFERLKQEAREYIMHIRKQKNRK